MIRGAVFIIILLGLSKFIRHMDLLPADEAWLLSGVVAVLASYWFSPRPPKSYFVWLRISLTFMLGIYICAFKLPWLFVDFVSYRVASLICLSVYVGVFWLISRWRSRPHSPKQKSMQLGGTY